MNGQQSAEAAFATWCPTGARPRSVYIHIPFCRHRCGYCNFSLVANRDYLVDRFLNALQQEISWLDDRYELDTLFLGGGTPSHLSADNLDRLSSIFDTRFDFEADAEITAECNPNDLSETTANALARLGVNRISLGVQSLNPEKLARLERDHQREHVLRAFEQARQFARSISLDLIFAAPDETLDDWKIDLQAALSLAPDHISTYELTYEKGTPFWNRQTHGELLVADEDLRADMYLAAIESIGNAGLQPYEISSFSKPGHRCLHNESYWTGRPYFAYGPGASRYVDQVRATNHQSTTQYLKLIESGNSAIAFTEKLSPEDSARELLAIGLRRIDGVNEIDFAALTQFQIQDLLHDVAQSWQQQGLIESDVGVWRLTARGRMLCDQLAGQIVNR